MKIFLLLLIAYQAQANELGIFSELFGRPDRKQTPKMSYDFTQYPARAVRNQNTPLRQRKQNLSIGIPISQSSSDKINMGISLGNENLDSNATVPVTNEKIPSTFWNPNIAAAYVHELENSSTQIYSLGIGSPSDRPFSRWRLLAANANFVWKVPSYEKNAWMFFVNWSNNRSFLNYLPLPGIGYFWGNADTWKLALGIPFFFYTFQPSKKWLLMTSYFPLVQAQIKISYFLFGPAHVYAQLKSESKNYLFFTRTRDTDRLFVNEKTASVGATMPLNRITLCELSGGYSFDRDLFIGERYRDRNNGRKINYAGAGFGMIKISAQL